MNLPAKIVTFGCLLLLPVVAAISQNPDSITVIPMATGIPDTPDNQSASKPARLKRTPNPDSFWRRVYLGGNLGFQFGSVTGFNVSPEVRVRVVDQFYLGAGFIYQFFRVNNYFYDTTDREYVSYTSNTFGGRIFARYYLSGFLDNWAGNFFAHVEYEYLHYIIPFEYDPRGRYIDIYTGYHYSKGKETLQINSVFVGGGYRQFLSQRAFIDFLILFNLNDSPESPYANPVFRLGFGVGL